MPPHLIVLAVDGLRASALGAYGNTWFATPALDQLAADSEVFDWFFADSPALPQIYHSLWSGIPAWLDPSGEVRSPGESGRIIQVLSDRAYETLLITDSRDVAQLPGSDSFDRTCLLATHPANEPAEDVSQTRVFATLSALAEEIAAPRSPGEALFAWTHCRFVEGPWDAPLGLSASLVEADDPEPSPTVSPSVGVTSEDAELPFLASVRYAAQVLALDACIKALIEAADQALGVHAYSVVLLGVRGYALGEHGRIGGSDARPYAEMRHVPMSIRSAKGPFRHVRSQEVAQSCDFFRFLGQTLGFNDLAPERDRRLPDHGAAVLHSPTGGAVHTPEWRLVQGLDQDSPTSTSSISTELYVHPDDRWQANDVAALKPDVVEELSRFLPSNSGAED